MRVPVPPDRKACAKMGAEGGVDGPARVRQRLANQTAK
jgi:hypothetical protein